jgi:hypothetical protein
MTEKFIHSVSTQDPVVNGLEGIAPRITLNSPNNPSNVPPNMPRGRSIFSSGNMGGGNSGTANTRNVNDLDRLTDIVSNLYAMRMELIKSFTDPRRDIDDECGYPRDVASGFSANNFQDLFEREPIATRVVQLLPKESWQVTPTVYEDEDSDNVTDFEQAWDDLGKGLRGKSWHNQEKGSSIWEYLARIDELSGIGTFGVILLGIDDGRLLNEPADGVDPDGFPSASDMSGVSTGSVRGASPTKAQDTKNPKDLTKPRGPVSKDIYGGAITKSGDPYLDSKMGTDSQYLGTQFSPSQATKKDTEEDSVDGKPARKLLFIRVFPEYLIQIVQYEANMYSPRFGQPLMYKITLNDPRQPHTGVGLPLSTVMVHWSRVIHIADNLTSSEIFGVPRMRPVLNRLLDLRKLYGGSAEMYWKGAFPGYSIETNPQLGGDVAVDTAAIQDMMENYMNGLQRYMQFMGMTAKSLSPQVVDPTTQIQVQLEAICIQLACPIRVFKGSERGELASSQDDSAWNDRLRHRQNEYITPKIIVPFIDRLIMLGVLPEPSAKGTKSISKDDIPKSIPTVKPTPGVGKDPNEDIPGMQDANTQDATEDTNPQDTQSTKEQSGATGAALIALLKGGNKKPVANQEKSGRGYKTYNRYYMIKPPVYNEDTGVMEEPAKYGSNTVIETPGGYCIEWPDLDSLSDKDKAGIALQETQALAAYVAGNVEAMVPPHDFLTRVLKWDEEEASQVLIAAAEAVEEKQEEADTLADQHGLEPEAPEGYQKPAPKPIIAPGMGGGIPGKGRFGKGGFGKGNKPPFMK